MTARAGVLAMSIVACTHPRPPANGADLERVQRWWIVIGHSPVLESLDWRHYARDAQMVVLSTDPRIPIGQFPESTIRLAYVSVAETDTRWPNWPALQNQPFIVEPNPDWPANVRVDIRDPRWQDRLLREDIPPLIARGFDGVMLDTIDTAPYLERKDPTRFAGSRQALRDWARRLRERFPEAHVTLLTPSKLRDLWLAPPQSEGGGLHHPAVNEVISFAADEGLLSVGHQLRKSDFDLALVLPNSPRSAMETWLARIPQRIGYARPWRNWFLTQALPPRPGRVATLKTPEA